MRQKKQDRRAHPRAQADVPAQVVLTDDNQEPVTAQTVNLSGSGVYLVLPEPIEAGTRLLISLIIPMRSEGEVRNHFFDFEGVVVRNEGPCEEEDSERYYVAVHFTGARDKDKELIDRFIRKKLDDGR